MGLLLIVLFILSIFLLPFLNKGIIKSSLFKPYHTLFVWIFFSVCLLLGWIGGLPVIYPFYTLGQIVTFLYFFILLVIFPFLNFLETVIYLSYVQKNIKGK
jgi:quinol-cytochrome oxidoreductase complex cytochrome b subunit